MLFKDKISYIALTVAFCFISQHPVCAQDHSEVDEVVHQEAWLSSSTRDDVLKYFEIFNGKKQEASAYLAKEILDNDHAFFDDLVQSGNPQQMDLLLDSLLDGQDSQLSAYLAKDLESNALNYAKYFSLLSQKIKKNPHALHRIQQSLATLRSEVHSKGLKWPTPERCMTWVLTYIGLRSTLHSLRSGFIYTQDLEVDQSFTHLSDRISSMALGTLGFICTAELVVTRKEYSSFLKSLASRHKESDFLKHISELTQAAQYDKHLLEKAKSTSLLRDLDKGQTTRVISMAFDKLERDLNPAEHSLHDVLKDFRFDEALTKFYKTLSPEDQKLVRENMGGHLANGELQKAELLMLRLQASLKESIKTFLSERGELGKWQLVEALYQSEVEKVKKLQANSSKKLLLTKACMATVAGGLALYGHLASIGKQDTPIDNDFDRWIRAHSRDIHQGLAASLAIPCIGQFVVWPWHAVNIQNLQRDSHLMMSPEDWRLLRELVLESKNTNKELSKGELSKAQELRAIDLMAEAVEQFKSANSQGKNHQQVPWVKGAFLNFCDLIYRR